MRAVARSAGIQPVLDEVVEACERLCRADYSALYLLEQGLDYGALGPVANLASRLSTRAAAGQILVGQRLFAAVEERVDTAPAGDLELKGFARPVAAYEVRGLR